MALADLRKNIAWVGKELVRAILNPLTTWLWGAAVFLLLPLGLWFKKGFSFLITGHEVPGWLISITISFVTLVIFVLIRNKVKIIQQRKNRTRPFTSLNLKWELTPRFWSNYKFFVVDDLPDSFFRSAIMGPFCPECETSLSSELQDGKCRYCEYEFDFIPISSSIVVAKTDIIALKRLVYKEAQSAARRKEI